MKRHILIAGLVALSLAGCAKFFAAGDPERPKVSVVNGRITVDQETIVFEPDKRNVLITWQLPRGQNLTFPRNGIVIQQGEGEFVECGPRNEGLDFSCLNRHTRPGRYKYNIQVLESGRALEPLDPHIFNK